VHKAGEPAQFFYLAVIRLGASMEMDTQ
jgi:hypothetical protein